MLATLIIYELRLEIKIEEYNSIIYKFYKAKLFSKIINNFKFLWIFDFECSLYFANNNNNFSKVFNFYEVHHNILNIFF